MTLAVVILAAGKSTRFKSATPKVLHDFGEKPMIAYSLDLAAQLSDVPPVLVVGEETDAPLREWAGDRARFVYQAQRLGTGHAVLQARELLQGDADRVLVLYADMPLLRTSSLQRLIAIQEERRATMAMITIVRDNSQGFGRVLRDNTGRVLRVVEEPEATPEQLLIRELNAGIYVYDADFLWTHLPQITPSAEKGEIYLTDMVEIAAEAGHTVADLVLDDPAEAMGINTRVDFADALAVLRRRITTHWMLEGVTIVDPATTYIGPDVTIGRDTLILPNTHLIGNTAIGENCEIGPNAWLDTAAIGDRCRVTASVIEHSEMEHDSDIGPFSHLPPGRAHLHRRPRRQLRRAQEVHPRARLPPGTLQLPRRHHDRRPRQHRRRHHHLQLRRQAQAPHDHRGRRLHRVGLAPGRPGAHRRGSQDRRRIGGHPRRAAPHACLWHPGTSSCAAEYRIGEWRIGE